MSAKGKETASHSEEQLLLSLHESAISDYKSTTDILSNVTTCQTTHGTRPFDERGEMDAGTQGPELDPAAAADDTDLLSAGSWMKPANNDMQDALDKDLKILHLQDPQGQDHPQEMHEGATSGPNFVRWVLNLSMEDLNREED